MGLFQHKSMDKEDWPFMRIHCGSVSTQIGYASKQANISLDTRKLVLGVYDQMARSLKFRI